MKCYSWLTNHFFINGVEITGFGEGDDVLSVKRRKPMASDKMGAGGKMMVSLLTDKSVEVRVKLQQTSPSNSYLNKLAMTMEGPATFVPVEGLWQDTYRQDRGVTSLGYISEIPEFRRGEEAGEQEWAFVFERGDFLLGNPEFAGLPTAIAEGLGG